ncbi:MAG: hypothetical protein JWO22_2893 [Frankiales bacterium]|nr:hypothetical protein [Frankiales bacterium]
MAVPDHVRLAALAAFDRRREGAVLLELIDDTCTGSWELHPALPAGVTRVLVFAGPGLLARVSVLDVENGQRPEGVARLEVRTTPEIELLVEVLSPRTDVSLRSGPGSRVLVSAPSHGPLSMVLSRVAAGAVRGRDWQTSWITL